MKIIGIILLVAVVIYCNIWTYNNNVFETERFALSKKAEIVSIKKHWITEPHGDAFALLLAK